MSGVAQSLAPTRVRHEIGSWLPVVAPLALLAAALAAIRSGLVVQDTWLALVAGREIVQHGLPSVSHLTVASAGHRWVDQQWLAQVVLYGCARVGGLGLALAACVASTLAALGVCARVALRRGASPLAIVALLFLSVAAAPWGLQLRPQSFGLLFFALTLSLLERDRQLPVLVVLCVWANVHGSVVIGIALALVYAVTTREPLLLLSPAMLFASPYARHLAGYYRTMLVDPPFGHAIGEWQRTTPSARTAAFFLLVGLTTGLVWRRRRRLLPFDLFVLALTLALGIDALRGTVWFALAALALVPQLATRREHNTVASAAGVLAASAAVVAALVFVAARPPVVFASSIVASAHGHAVLASDATADWLLWEDPSLRGRVGYDLSFELLSKRQIAGLVAWRELSPGWQRVVRGYDVVVDDRRHVTRLIATGGWRRVEVDGRVAVARRTRS